MIDIGDITWAIHELVKERCGVAASVFHSVNLANAKVWTTIDGVPAWGEVFLWYVGVTGKERYYRITVEPCERKE